MCFRNLRENHGLTRNCNPDRRKVDVFSATAPFYPLKPYWWGETHCTFASTDRRRR
jgi:hypothetical protein